MSAAFDRGRNTEREVAGILRKKLGARVERDKRSGAGTMKADIRDYYQELPVFIECKDQETIKIKEWMRQASEGASVGQPPTVVFRMDEDGLMACLPFSDLVNFFVELADLRAEIDDLRKPIVMVSTHKPMSDKTKAALVEVGRVVDKQILRGAKTCPNGHIIMDSSTLCLSKGCKYSRGYRPPKGKK
jgi:hypothetical protein